MKKYTFTIIIFLIALFCIIFPQDMITATKSGLTLWYNIIVPSLLPFLILSDLISKSALPYLFGKLFSPMMKFVFQLPGISSVALFLGMTGGYPIGAKTTSDLLKNSSISLNTANHLITFVNNAGPLFLLGAIGIGLYKSSTIGLLLLLSHYLGAIFTGFIFRFLKKQPDSSIQAHPIHIETIRLSKLSTILTETIKHSIQLICVIGGFILIFSVFSTLLEKTGLLLYISKLLFPTLHPQTTNAILSGILEVTTGVNKIATLSLSLPLIYKLIITSMLISFGGFSIHLQTLSVLNDTNISFSRYLLGKLTQSIFSGIITYFLLLNSNFSILLATSTATTPAYNEVEINIFLSIILVYFLFIIIFKLLQLYFYRKKEKNPY